jgi:hypothetical protein
MYKNNQTTSTKCQYHAATSNPKWWFDEKCSVVCRRRYVVRNIVPIFTCYPWNPVATKNVDPYAESVIANCASKYLYACSAVKYNPNRTVKNNPWVPWVALFSSSPWCAHVTVTPDVSRIVVFSRWMSSVGQQANRTHPWHQPAATLVNSNRCCKNSQVLRMMGENIARNM